MPEFKMNFVPRVAANHFQRVNSFQPAPQQPSASNADFRQMNRRQFSNRHVFNAEMSKLPLHSAQQTLVEA